MKTVGFQNSYPHLVPLQTIAAALPCPGSSIFQVLKRLHLGDLPRFPRVTQHPGTPAEVQVDIWDMEAIYESLTTRVLQLQTHVITTDQSPKRILIALAGVPGAGKSTIAAEVVKRINKRNETPCAAVLPVDGFHLTRAQLDVLPNRAEAYARRGAAWTYDARGVVELIRSLYTSSQEGSWLNKTFLAPGFDHVFKDPVSNAITISSQISFIVIEGNWLLFDEEPWSEIQTMVNETWFVDVDDTLAMRRVARRHIQSGIENNWDAAVRRTETNDLLNGQLIRQKLIAPDVSVISVDQL